MYTRYAKLRDKAGLNDCAVASATGIPQSTIYDWKQRSAENPNATISILHLQKIATLLSVPLEDFLGDQ